MSLKIDKVQLEIIMKADNARAEMIKLDDEAKAIQKSMRGLKKDSEEYIKKNEELNKVKARMQELRKEIGLTGMNMRELQSRSRELTLQLRNLDPRSERFKEMRAELDKVNARMRELRGNAAQTEGGLSKLANGFNKYFSIVTAGIASITGLSFAFRKLAEDVAKMDDVYADVMKTTGMTRDQVLALNEEFKKMNTRTTREDLNLLARDAGKLGIEGTKNIMDFVDAGNQIRVSLGEDLGEDAIKNIGKMVGVFEASTKQLKGAGLKEQMLAAGSAINELGASSTASEPYLVNFAGRLGGISKQAKISMADILGFASALDQDMQAVEMSATALQQFIMKVMGEPAKFARLAGMNVKDFSNLLKTDANQAVKSVLKAMNEKGGFQDLIPIFQNMGLDGARAVGVLSTLAGSIEKVDEAQRVANDAMYQGVSITNEYNIKNNNLAAQLDKAKKAFRDKALELGEKLNPALLKSTNALTYLIKSLVELPKWLKENKALVIALASTLGTYIIAITAYRIARALSNKETEKSIILRTAEMIKVRASIAADYAQAAAKALLTGSIKAATVAMRGFLVTLGINPFVAAAVAIAAITVGVYKLVTAKSKLTKAYKEFIVESETERRNATWLFSAIKNLNEGTIQRRNAINEINSKYGEYLPNLLTEKSTLEEINAAQNLVNAGIREKIALKMKDELASEIMEKQIKIQTNNLEKIRKNLITQLGERNADIMIKNIHTYFDMYGKDTEKARLAIQDMFKKYGVSNSLVGKAAGSGFFDTSSLHSNLLDLTNSYSKMYDEIDKVDKKFSGFIKGITTKPAAGSTLDGPKKGDEQFINGVLMRWDGKKWVRVKQDDPGEPTDKELKELKKKYDAELKTLADNHSKRIAELKTQYNDEKMLRIAILGEEIKFLEDKQKLQEQYNQNSGNTEEDLAGKILSLKKESDKQILDSIKDSYKAKTIATDELERLEKQKLLDNYSTKQQLQIDTAALDVTLSEQRLANAREFADQITIQNFETEDAKVKAVEDANKEVVKAEENLLNTQKKHADIKYSQEEEYQRKRQALIDKYNLDSNTSISAQYKKELEELKEALKNKLIELEEYERAVAQLKARTVENYATQALKYLDKVKKFVADYNEYETSSLEAEKQKQLTIAGDNAEQRQRVEEEFANKELELRKKQATSEATIKIAEALASAALGVVNVWSKYATNPLLAAALSGLIAFQTGIQIKAIAKQRDAIMNTSVQSYSSSSTPTTDNTPKVATRVAQAAEGRYDVIGADDNRTYKKVPYRGLARTMIVSQPTLMGERGDELIVDHRTLQNLRIRAPHVLNTINRLRVPQRADGNYQNVSDYSGTAESKETVQLLRANLYATNKLISLVSELEENGIKASVLLSELERKAALRDTSIKKGSLKP